MADINSTRRYYLLKRLFARQACEEEGVWKHKQEAVSGTALPASFPLLSELAELGYTTVEDLDGADAAELRGQGLKPRQAERVLAALAPLL